MAKRRLSLQQKQRIKSAQASIDLDHADHFQGTVIAHHGGELEVEPDHVNATRLACKFRTNLGAIVTGDKVVYQVQNDEAAIISVIPRSNLLQRQDGFGQIKSVAANITQLIICLAIEPSPNLYLLDQYLVSAEQQDLNVIILLNKMDLLEHPDPDPFLLKSIYLSLGYQILEVSVKTGLNIDQLQELCKDHINVISGVSGVGKSSITKAILPDIEIAIGEISDTNKEGRHTTRTSHLYHLPRGGQLIDTPGIRGFNPVLDTQQPLSHGFREIHNTAHACKFSNCKHLNEPKCAVRAAVEMGTIAASRYENYVKLLQNQD